MVIVELAINLVSFKLASISVEKCSWNTKMFLGFIWIQTINFRIFPQYIFHSLKCIVYLSCWKYFYWLWILLKSNNIHGATIFKAKHFKKIINGSKTKTQSFSVPQVFATNHFSFTLWAQTLIDKQPSFFWQINVCNDDIA